VNSTETHHLPGPHPGLASDSLPGAAPGQYLRFALGKETYAVGIAAVREILEMARMTPLPLMPGFIKGVMNLRGAVVPVIDLRARCGLETVAVGRRSCIVVVEVSNHEDSEMDVLGMLIDGVHEVLEVNAQDIEPTPPLGTRIAPEFIAGMAKVRGDIVAILNLERVLEREDMAKQIAEHRCDD
jgi:purine-binding chemotaxis protein CheW